MPEDAMEIQKTSPNMRPTSFKPYGSTGESDMAAPDMLGSGNLDHGRVKSPNETLKLLGADQPYNGSK